MECASHSSQAKEAHHLVSKYHCINPSCTFCHLQNAKDVRVGGADEVVQEVIRKASHDVDHKTGLKTKIQLFPSLLSIPNTHFQIMFADLCLIGDDFAVVSNKACVEVEDDVDEEKDVHHGIKNQHCDITCVARGPLEII